jgi:hypothetical protein
MASLLCAEAEHAVRAITTLLRRAVALQCIAAWSSYIDDNGACTACNAAGRSS